MTLILSQQGKAYAQLINMADCFYRIPSKRYKFQENTLFNETLNSTRCDCHLNSRLKLYKFAFFIG